VRAVLGYLRSLGLKAFLGLALVIALVGSGASIVAAELSSAPSYYTVTAAFSSANGLFRGAPVEVLGVPVGNVASVKVRPGVVYVVMSIKRDVLLPEDVTATLSSSELLDQPTVELSPGYTGGHRLRPGSLIPPSRTASSVTIPRLAKDLQSFLAALDTGDTKQLVHNIAADLAGEGGQLSRLIASASSFMGLLAQKGDELGRLNGELASLLATLNSEQQDFSRLVSSYDTVASVLAANGPALGQAISELAKVSRQVVNVLAPGIGPLESELPVLAQVAATLERNIDYIDSSLASSVALAEGEHNAYDASHRWYDLNDYLSPAMTGHELASMVVAQLASVCRRVLFNHSTGLTPGEVNVLASCGDPNSGFFAPLVGSIDHVLATLGSAYDEAQSATAPPPPASPVQVAGSAFASGLSEIPGVPPAASAPLAGAAASQSTPSQPPAPTPAAPAPTGSGEQPASGGITLPLPLIRVSLSDAHRVAAPLIIPSAPPAPASTDPFQELGRALALVGSTAWGWVGSVAGHAIRLLQEIL
jgi:virulence factor Mce-like protein